MEPMLSKVGLVVELETELLQMLADFPITDTSKPPHQSATIRG